MVQSWLASAVYGLADKAGGADAIRVVMGVLTVALFALVWRLARPAKGLVVRVAIAGLCLGVGAGAWDQRPLLFGLIGLGCTVLAAEGGLDPRWLLPVGWLWVNSHGSFPLGIVYLAVVALGRRLDGGFWDTELRALRWLAGGVVLGAVNPIGPKILVFPIELLQKQDVLKNVIEWQAPGFQTVTDRIFLVQVVVAVLALVRRPRYRHGLVLAVFLAAALLGARNMGVASIVLVPLMADAWADVGGLRSDARDRFASMVAIVGVAALVLVAVVRLGEPGYDLKSYPVRELDRLAEHHVDLERVHMAVPDRVGNLIELRDGPGRRVFFDDRFDMFPDRVSDEVITLLHGAPGALRILDRRHIDLVLWRDSLPLVSILRAEGTAWRPVFDGAGDDGWALLCRVGADLGGDLGSC